MIDSLRLFSKKFTWLKPLLLLITAASICIFVYVIFFVSGSAQDIYLVPSIVSLLWVLMCWLILAVFPEVPAQLDKRQGFILRLKNGMMRCAYYLFSLIFVVLTLLILILTLKIFAVWYIEFYT